MRILSLILACLMIFTSFPATVFAAEEEGSASLDDIAWENYSYRDIFIENNLAYVDGFNGKDWGSFVQNTGTNEITNEEFYTGPYSLKVFGSSSQQLVSAEKMPQGGKYFLASKVMCTRYEKGTLGVCIGSNSVGLTGTSEGFVTSSGIVEGTASNKIFLGSFHSADLDGYVDDPVVVNMAIFENAPSLEKMTELYDNYVEIEKAIEREEIKYTDGEMLSAFVDYMNEKAAEIGMENSEFKDPVGMDNITTASDILRLMVHAYTEYEELNEIWCNSNYTVNVMGENARMQTVTSTVIKPALEDYYHILGGKTGTLSKYNARNLAVILEIPDSEDKLAVVVLYADGQDSDSINRFEAARQIADAALLKYNEPDYDNSSVEVCCKSAIACLIPAEELDFENLEILYEKDSETQRVPASITKVLASICVLDYIDDLDTVATYEDFDTQIGSFYAKDFYPGDKITVRDALYAALLPSSNVTARILGRIAGEKILEAKENEIIWEQGTIASVDGTNNSTKTRFRTADYLKLENYSGVTIGEGYTMTNFVYDESLNYLGTSSWLGEGIPFKTEMLKEKYPSGVYFRVVFRAVDQRNLTEEDVTASGVKFYLPGEEVPEPDFGFTFENLGSIGTWQDGDIHDGKLFVFGAAGTGAIFNLETLEKLGGITLDEKDVIKPHANSVCFGSTYYSEGDKYPLLYINIYNNYASSDDRMEGTCCVYRVLETEGAFSTELVQVIKIGFTEDLSLWKSKENNGDVRPYGNFVVDTDKNSLYAFVMRDANKTTRYFEFDIPEIGAGTFDENYGCNVVTLETADIKSKFDSEYYNYLQGCCYYGGKILYMGDFGGTAPLYLMDLESRKITDKFNLGHAGITAEPEVICVDDSDGNIYYCAADGILRELEIEAEFKDFSEIIWEQGTIAAATGVEKDYANVVRNKGYLNLSDYSGITLDAGYYLTYFVYDKDYNYLGNGKADLTANFLLSGEGISTSEMLIRYPEGVYFRIAFWRGKDGQMTVDMVPDSGISLYNAEHGPVIWEMGSIYAKSGITFVREQVIRCISYLPVEDYVGVGIGKGYAVGYLAYDENLNYLGNGNPDLTGYFVTNGFYTKDITENYPEAKYMKLIFRENPIADFTMEAVETSGIKVYKTGEEFELPEPEIKTENIMTMNACQDGAVFGKKVFLFNAAGNCNVYDIKSEEKIGSFTVDKVSELNPHANAVCFGNTYYEEGDKYPLLYVNIYNNYWEGYEDKKEGTCCVYRITEENGVFGSKLVQVIKIGFTDDYDLWNSVESNGYKYYLPYGNFVVDTDKDKLWTFVLRNGEEQTRFFEFDLPVIGDGTYNETYGCNLVTLEAEDILKMFDTEHLIVIQGCCYYGGKILSVSGIGSGTVSPPYLQVIDPEKGEIEKNLSFEEIGITNEPEMISVDPIDGTIYYASVDGILRKIQLSVEFNESTPCGSSAFWKIEDGVLKIYGSGAVFDYNSTDEIPWYENREEITALEIGEGITAIGKRNFAGLENIISAKLPESLEKIGDYAFWNCSSLYDIVLPENLSGMGTGAFFGCSAFDYIVIPSAVTVLEQSVFTQCEKLDTVVLHDGITEIKKEAFSRCYGLFHFAMPSGLETIGYHAFFGCANLQQLTFAENIRKIEDAAFYGCANLSVLRFSGNSPEFSEKAFLDITADVFYPLGDESWTETVKQNYGGTITWYSECYHNYKAEITEPTCVLEGFTTHTCKICGNSYVDTYTEPTGHSFGEWETVTEATFTEDGTESRTCTKCSHVEYRSIPLTVITSGNFGYGTEPTDKVIYTLYSNGTMIVEGEGMLFGRTWNGKCQPFIDYRKDIKHIIIGEGITQTAGGCFAYLSNLETVEFPSTLKKLPNNAFMSSFAESVTSLTIPETVTYIGAYAFGHYGGESSAYFTDIIIENPDIEFNDHKAVFNGGSKLDELTLYSYGAENNVSAYAEKYGIRYIDLNNYRTGEFGGIKYEFYNGVLTLSTESEGLSIPAENAPWNEYKNEITKIEIESGISGISENAFANYPVLNEVELPDDFKSVGDGAFAVTEGEFVPLNITIPKRIETIGKDIFKGRENVSVTAYYGSVAENLDEPGVNLNLKKVFKILFIGNSYTEDATCCGQKMPDSQLFDAMQAMLGEDAEVVLGVIISGGKGINWHATQADRGNKSYTLRTMSSEDKTWKAHGTVTSMDALAFTDWDAVSIQVYNVNVNTGEESVPYPEQTDSKFYKLEAASEFMLDLFAEHAPYADAYFYMHWAQTSTIALNANLKRYNEMAEYIPVVLDYEGTESGKQFENIVPVGLSVQNARTTYLALLSYNTTAYADGNLNLYTDAQIGLQRDGGHLSFNIGRYIAGLTFAEMVIPEEMREENYVLPDIRITESIGKLPKEYTEIAQKSVFAAVESWKNGSLEVTEIEGYKVDPVDIESAKLAEAKIGVSYAADVESLKARISEAVLEALPKDFDVESVALSEDFEITGEGQEFEAEIEIRFGYMFKKVTVSFAVEKALIGDINLDGSVNVMDAYYARLVAAKLVVPTEQQILVGDVDGDGKITAIDANLIRKFAAKIIEKLPVKA